MLKRAMNPALWKKAISDAWLTLAVSATLLILFCWLFVWLMSLFDAGAWGTLLNLLPDFFRPMLGVPLAKLATPAGQLSILYTHLITLLVCVGWALGRGSDSISGEIGRGTMDLLLALPVRRVSVLIVPAVAATAGAAVLAFSVWAGMCLGLLSIEFENPPAPRMFLPGAWNLFAMTFCFTGITALFSSWNRDRWRTILQAGGFFVFSLMVKIVARMWADGAWLGYFSFLSLFEPQELILVPPPSGWSGLSDDLLLIAIGLVCYAVAALIFWCRDIPPPL
ncbi:MAG: ABC transporter permease subunit [Pirellulales bacterium]|nr:ABC transporter permease subunit [Pirellulales bacterium]